MNEIDDYLAEHEHLALLAVETTDRWPDPTVPVVMEEIVNRAPDVALLLTLAIVQAEERALRGEAPDGPRPEILADYLRTQGGDAK